MPDNQIGLEALFNDEDFQKGISSYNSSISDSTSLTESSGSTMSAVWDGLASVGAIAFEAIAIGIAAMTAELYFAVDAALETEQVLARMEFVVDNVGERTGVASEDVLALADSLSQVVPIDDEVIASAITMGLTFDGVNKDNIQPLIEAAADLSQWTGKDLPGTMKSLALAISDPEKAMRLMRDANITLTDEQADTLKAFKATGDSAGATTFILEQLRKKGILGLGRQMGDTAKGGITIMNTAIGNLHEALGTGLLDALRGVTDKITDFASDPRTIAFFTDLGVKIGDIASAVISKLPDIISTIQGISDWLVNNKPIVIGILAAIGVAMVAFGVSVASAAYAAIVGLAPVLAIMAVVGVAVGLLYKAWTENWGGIQDKVKSAWTQVKPVFDRLSAWLAVNLPKAIKALSAFWTNTLLPALKNVFGWIADNVIPVLVDLVLWLGDNIPKAIKTLSNFWTNTLLPAITAVYKFISGTLIPNFKDVIGVISNTFTAAIKTLSSIWTGVLLPALTTIYNFFNNNIMPVIRAVANLLDAVLGLAVRVLAGLWQNVLQPALSSVWSFISNNIIPIFNTVANVANGVLSGAIRALATVWTNVLSPAITTVKNILSPFATFLSTTLYNAFNGIRNVVQWVIDKINGLATSINNLALPDWLTPGSPTPFELGLRGINSELDKLAASSLPVLRMQLDTMRDVSSRSNTAGLGNVSNSSQRTNNYLFGPQFNVNNSSGMIEILQGLS